MEQKQCLVCGVTDGILDGIIKCVLHGNDIEVYDCPTEFSSDQFNSFSNVINEQVSYLIVGKDKKQLPDEYKKILNNNNELLVIELLNNGKSLSLYVDDVNAKILNKIINLNA